MTDDVITLRLPRRALARVDGAIETLAREGAQPLRRVNSAEVNAAYAVIETYGLLLDLAQPSNPEYVRHYVEKAVQGPVEISTT